MQSNNEEAERELYENKRQQQEVLFSYQLLACYFITLEFLSVSKHKKLFVEHISFQVEAQYPAQCSRKIHNLSTQTTEQVNSKNSFKR